MQNFFNKLKAYFYRPVDPASLGVFRIIFGLIIVKYALGFFDHNLIYYLYIKPEFHFAYFPFEFIKPLAGNGMYFYFALLALLGLMIAVGLFYRVTSAALFVLFTYGILIDKAYYNNHYYCVALICFLLIFMDAHKWLSIDCIRCRKLRSQGIPFWNLFILKAQIFIVYFFGGVAKISVDWFRGEPLRTVFATRSEHPLIGSYVQQEWFIYLFSYGGLIFDLAIGFLLLMRRTRILAFFLIVCFNVINGSIFNIGIFPYLMIGATILFFEPDLPRRCLTFLENLWSKDQHKTTNVLEKRASLGARSNNPTWTIVFVLLYLLIQIAVPLRHWLYPGNVFWTREGGRFSWHMKTTHRVGKLKIFITDPQNGKTIEVDRSEDLNLWQRNYSSSLPDMIYQYTQFLKKKWQDKGILNPIITVDAQVSLNSRPFAPIIASDVDFGRLEFSPLRHTSWVLPLKRQTLNP